MFGDRQVCGVPALVCLLVLALRIGLVDPAAEGEPTLGETVLRGVHPARVAHYARAVREGTWTCDSGGGRTIEATLLNDGFCDCAGDGSDEPGTAACSHVVPDEAAWFSCAVARKKASLPGSWSYEQRVRLSAVDDGRCDCCDCSDEVARRDASGGLGCATAQVVALDEVTEEAVRHARGVAVLSRRLQRLLPGGSGAEQALAQLGAHADQLWGTYEQYREYLSTIPRAQLQGAQQQQFLNLVRSAQSLQKQALFYRTFEARDLGRDASFDGAEFFPLLGTCLNYTASERDVRGGCARPSPKRFLFTVCPLEQVYQYPIEEEEEEEARAAAAVADGEEAVLGDSILLGEFQGWWGDEFWSRDPGAGGGDGEGDADAESAAAAAAARGVLRRGATRGGGGGDEDEDEDEETEEELAWLREQVEKDGKLMGDRAKQLRAARLERRAWADDVRVRQGVHVSVFGKGAECWGGEERQVVLRLACGERDVVTQVLEDGTCRYRVQMESPSACSPARLAELLRRHRELGGDGQLPGGALDGLKELLSAEEATAAAARGSRAGSNERAAGAEETLWSSWRGAIVGFFPSLKNFI